MEDPHSIAELVREYESEETELNKDKKCLVDKWTKERNETDVHDPRYQYISEFIADINQLDEPKTLSEYWVEQKYYVDLYSAAYIAKWGGNDQVSIYTDDISGSEDYEFYLTEQEIKYYDERFWPFAVKVEELEE